MGVPAAQYVRMSTEHQRYSTDNQMEAIAEYAAKNNMVLSTRRQAPTPKSSRNTASSSDFVRGEPMLAEP